jgi:hypothetical protein
VISSPTVAVPQNTNAHTQHDNRNTVRRPRDRAMRGAHLVLVCLVGWGMAPCGGGRAAAPPPAAAGSAAGEDRLRGTCVYRAAEVIQPGLRATQATRDRTHTRDSE